MDGFGVNRPLGAIVSVSAVLRILQDEEDNDIQNKLR